MLTTLGCVVNFKVDQLFRIMEPSSDSKNFIVASCIKPSTSRPQVVAASCDASTSSGTVREPVLSRKSLPAVLSYAYKNLILLEKKWTAECKFCKKNRTKTDALGTTSNFLGNSKKCHPAAHSKYLVHKKQPDEVAANSWPITQPPITAYLQRIYEVPANYGANDPQTGFLNELLIRMIVLGGMPSSNGEKEGFNSLYTTLSRRGPSAIWCDQKFAVATTRKTGEAEFKKDLRSRCCRRKHTRKCTSSRANENLYHQ